MASRGDEEQNDEDEDSQIAEDRDRTAIQKLTYCRQSRLLVVSFYRYVSVELEARTGNLVRKKNYKVLRNQKKGNMKTNRQTNTQQSTNRVDVECKRVSLSSELTKTNSFSVHVNEHLRCMSVVFALCLHLLLFLLLLLLYCCCITISIIVTIIVIIMSPLLLYNHFCGGGSGGGGGYCRWCC